MKLNNNFQLIFKSLIASTLTFYPVRIAYASTGVFRPEYYFTRFAVPIILLFLFVVALDQKMVVKIQGQLRRLQLKLAAIIVDTIVVAISLSIYWRVLQARGNALASSTDFSLSGLVVATGIILAIAVVFISVLQLRMAVKIKEAIWPTVLRVISVFIFFYYGLIYSSL